VWVKRPLKKSFISLGGKWEEVRSEIGGISGEGGRGGGGGGFEGLACVRRKVLP